MPGKVIFIVLGERAMLKNYLKKVGFRRIIIMITGNIVLGLGIAIFKLSGLGNDPFSGMVMALADVTGIVYANFLILFNLGLFVIQFLTGREFIGAGTIINACFLGYFVTFFYDILVNAVGKPGGLSESIIMVCAGVIVCGLGVSMYQTSDVGIAPFDALSIIMAKRWNKIPYFWHRMATDATAALVCFLAGGIVGLGTLVSAFGLGPFVHFFNVHFSEKLVDGKKTRQ